MLRPVDNEQTGLATTGHGSHISVPEALTLIGDARIIPVVLGKTRQITEYGTAHRIFTEVLVSGSGTPAQA